jgi:iron complex transport system substrate-binding protein
MRTHFLAILLLAVVASCAPRNETPTAGNSRDSTTINYATGFRIRHLGAIKEVVVSKPYQGAAAGYTYWLVPKDMPVPKHAPEIKIIRIPIENIVCTSTTHIPLLDYLGETQRLIGFPTTDYISSEKMRARIDSGNVTDLGVDKGLNLELLASLTPDLVMAYTMTGDYGQFKKIEELNMNVVLNAEYLEEHPLGRAEWIKFMALFFNKEKVADSVFAAIKNNYLTTKEKVQQAGAPSPTVMSGIVYGDAWFMPAGQNYAAKLLRDAGFNYLWSSDSANGFLQLSFEAVYEKANEAAYWIGVGSYNTLAEIQQADHRYANFNAFKTKHVYTYNARIGATGGSEFLELGYLRPDLILNDLVTIAHPQVLPAQPLYFHKKLN